MIEKIEMSGNGYRIEEPFKKYAEKRIGKLDRYLPRGFKKDVVAKIVVAEKSFITAPPECSEFRSASRPRCRHCRWRHRRTACTWAFAPRRAWPEWSSGTGGGPR